MKFIKKHLKTISLFVLIYVLGMLTTYIAYLNKEKVKPIYEKIYSSLSYIHKIPGYLSGDMYAILAIKKGCLVGRTGEYGRGYKNEYSILSIGNSISFTPEWKHWFSDCGASATRPDKDFVNVLAKTISECNQYYVKWSEQNFSWWERSESKYRNTTMLQSLNKYLNPTLNLVIIEVGENINNTTTTDLENDYCNLINYIKEHSNAHIVLIDDFWYNELKHNIKINAAKRTNIDFVNLIDIKENIKEYESYIGEKVLGNDGNLHSIDHQGVANHPNDKAHKLYAERIYNFLDLN